MEKNNKSVVAIVVRDCLQPTQIWILRHANGLHRFKPVFIARRRTRPKKRSNHRIHVMNSLALATWSLNLTGKLLLRNPFLGYAFYLKKILRMYRVPLVHIHFLWNAVWFFDYLKNVETPVVVTAHGSDVNQAFSDPEYRKQVQEVLTKADRIICVSHFIRDRLLDLGCNEAKLLVNYLGVPVKEKILVKKTDSDKTRLICVAALREEKGHVYLIKALEEVRRRFTNIQLTLVGDGKLKNNIGHVVRESNLEDCVFFLGWKNEAEVYELLANSDIFVLHSIRHTVKGKYYKEEGLPISLVEAASMGLPLVATKIGGIPEICIHGYNGLLSPEKDICSMAENIAYLIENPDTCSLYGRNGQRLIRDQFDESKLLKRLEKIYEDCIKEFDSR